MPIAVSRTSLAALLAAILVVTGCTPQPDAASLVSHPAQVDAPALKPAEPAPTEPAALVDPPAQQKTAQASPATVQRDQQLIDSVERAYQTGVTNYRDGHLAAAKANFDYAVDLMLSSGLDLKSDPQLNDEFEHVVDAVNTLEMEALKQGNGFAPRTEAAPVDIANDVTFPVDPTVKAEAQAELKTTVSDLPLVLNDYVASYINFFANTTKGHNTIVHSLSRAGRYKDMIQRVLSQEGVPQDLIYQAVAESGFHPQAVDARSGAGGMWQFMPSGNYGLARSGWYDERFDPEKSTHAYARYIKMLYNQFGDWYLAMAAYDWGAGNVQRAVQRTGYADFWELYRRNALPQETKNYVPIILAATIMAKNPTKYGLDTMVFDPALVTDTVTIDYAIDLRLVADLTDTPVQEIIGLNPSLLRLTTPSDESFDLHIPAGATALFNRRIAEIPEEKRRYWRYHKLAAGETLDDVSHTFRVPASDIAFVNQLSSTSADLTGTEALIIPVTPASAPSPFRNALYRAHRGDTLVTVADRFGVTVDQLRRWNHLSGTALTAGRSLYVSEPAHNARTSHTRHRKGKASGTGSASQHRASRSTSSKQSTQKRTPHSSGKSSASNSTHAHTRKHHASHR